MKIIHILCHSPSPIAYESGPDDPPPQSSNPDDAKYAIKIDQPPYWICFAQNDFHVKLATEICRNTDRYENECWRPHRMADLIHSREINGIKHRVFPSREPRFNRPYFGEVAPQIQSELKREIECNDVIVHLHGFNTPFIDKMLMLSDLDKVPVLATQRGQGYPGFMVRERPWLLPRLIMQGITASRVDVYLMQSKFECERLAIKFGRERAMMHQDGLDLELIKPVDKKTAREKLDIPGSCNMLLYVGIFDSSRGMENAIWAFERLRATDKRIRLYLVGGHENHRLYKHAKSSNAIILGRIRQKELLNYYSAADIHVYPTSKNSFRTSTGISNANMESMACNTPLYTSQLVHFLGTREERDLVGMDSGLIHDRERMLPDIRSMLDRVEVYSRCREMVEKYYDRQKNTVKLIEIYKRVESEYFA